MKFSTRRVLDMSLEFFRLEAAGGILLVLAAVLALIVANSPFYGLYSQILNDTPALGKSALHWINDGLMAIFFLLVGLEIKREVIVGELSSRRKAILPALSAVGGIVVPAIFYVFFNHNHPEALKGWAIPCATDIAFALGVLSLLGNRVPVSLKILLTAIAIIDDLGAILIIALFYAGHLEVSAMLFSILPLTGLFLLNYFGIGWRWPYLLLGAVLWFAVMESGVHATMAGVITALFVPYRVEGERRSPSQRLEQDLHAWVVFLILPLFGFANAGVSLDGVTLHSFLEPVTLGIILGLVLGKQVGVFGTIWLGVKSGLCEKPGASWAQLYGLSVLCGIGFTMSLFIGGLAFIGDDLQLPVKLGVLAGSFISALAAYLILRCSPQKD